MCRSCFWASPENYTHVAEEQIRRVDIEWRGLEVKAFERLRVRAESEDVTVAALNQKTCQTAKLACAVSARIASPADPARPGVTYKLSTVSSLRPDKVD